MIENHERQKVGCILGEGVVLCRRFRIQILLLVMSVCAVFSGCASPEIRDDLTERERRADLDYLASVFADREQSFTDTTRALFEERLASVEARVGSVTHDQFLIGVQWAVAAADNGHTEALTHEHQRLRLPVDLHWFEDGLYVIAARPGYEDLLASRAASIEGATPTALLTELKAYSPGTDEHARILSGYFLERPELLAGIGRAAASNALTIDFVPPSGPTVTRTLPALAGQSTSHASDAHHLLDGVNPLPLYLREPEKAALLAWLPEIDAAYIRINRNDDQDLPSELSQFIAAIEERAPRNVIVDLRLNGGGNYLLTAPFAEVLPDSIPIDGRIVLILGNETFSAAIVTAAILKVRAGARALIVGDRPGDDLQYWSEGGFLTLPNSGLRIHYSDGYHDWRNGYNEDDPRYRSNSRNASLNQRFSVAAGSLEPSIRIPLRFDDYAAGHDPVMSKVRSILAGVQ